MSVDMSEVAKYDAAVNKQAKTSDALSAIKDTIAEKTTKYDNKKVRSSPRHVASLAFAQRAPSHLPRAFHAPSSPSARLPPSPRRPRGARA